MHFNILYTSHRETIVHFARVFADNEEEAIRIFYSENYYNEIVSISPTVWY